MHHLCSEHDWIWGGSLKHTKRHLYFYFQDLPFIRSYFRSVAVPFPNKAKRREGEGDQGEEEQGKRKGVLMEK